MTTEQAIEQFERVRNKTLALPGRIELIDAALSALYAQQEREKNEPLTLEELQRMGGQPIYVVDLQSAESFWALINVERKIAFDYIRIRLFTCYGSKWLAYRRPPNRKDETK